MPPNAEAPLQTEPPQPPTLHPREFDIRTYGAVEGNTADHTTINTQAFTNAIEAASIAGGGRVVTPPGVWHVGPIHLRSRVNLHVMAGAELSFSDQPNDYLPVVFQQRGGVMCFNYSPLIYACGSEDIAITGDGTLNGNGAAWWPWKNNQPGMERLFTMPGDGVPISRRVFGNQTDGVRPPFIQFMGCRRILLEGVTVCDGPSWQVHPVLCDDLTIRKLTVKAPQQAPNTDGIDPDACRRVLIEACTVDTGDDAICLKAGRDQDGWNFHRPCEHVTIRHCTVRNGHGGVVIGSEMSAGVRNVHVHDCVFHYTKRGVRLKSCRGRGGVIEGVKIHDIQMYQIALRPLIIDLEYKHDPGPGGTLPIIRDIDLRRLKCLSSGQPPLLRGLPGSPLRNISLESCSFPNHREAMLVQHCQLVNVKVGVSTNIGQDKLGLHEPELEIK